MKILHVISSLASGGAEVFVRDLSIHLAREGHEVCIAYVSKATDLGRDEDFETRFKSQLHEANVAYCEIGHACRRRLRRGGKKLKRIISEFRPDLLHSHLYYGLFFKAFAGVNLPVVYTHHSSRLGKGRYLYPLFNRIVDQYIGISRDCADALRRASAPAVRVIYNGINSERLHVKTSYGDNRGSLTMLSVGRLIALKNFKLLLQALEQIFGDRPDLRNRLMLVIAGEGPLKAGLLQQITRAGLTDNVRLLGNRNDIPELLHNADLFVMSSTNEGLPIALLEAMMTGLPVVVTDVGGCRDVVESCAAGLVVPSQDVAAMARTLEYVVDNPELRARMSASALLHSKIFDIATVGNNHTTLYRDVISRGRHA